MSRKNSHWLTGSHPYPFGLFLIMLGFVGIGTTNSPFTSLFVVAMGASLLLLGYLRRRQEHQEHLPKTPPSR